MSLRDYVSIDTKKRFFEGISGTSLPQIVSIATAHPPKRYTQLDIIELFGTEDPRIVRLFRQSHIRGRYLYLPEPDEDGRIGNETHHELISKHLRGSIELGTRAIEECLSPLRVAPSEVDHLICVTSTGLLLPGVSAHLVKHLGLRNDIQRTDIVGMGCCAGLMSLRCAAESAAAGAGRKKVLLLCVEINSAAYINDGTMQSSVVNSLFGDGAAAMLLDMRSDSSRRRASLAGFESRTFVEHMDLLKYDLLENEEHKISLILSKELPYVIGNNVGDVLCGLLRRHGLEKRDIAHWVVHAGGRKILDSIKYNLGLSDHDIRHTLAVHEEYGNLSSGSVFFTLDRLMKEKVAQEGDLCVLISMGPGLSIEAALVMW